MHKKQVVSGVYICTKRRKFDDLDVTRLNPNQTKKGRLLVPFAYYFYFRNLVVSFKDTTATTFVSGDYQLSLFVN